MNTCKIICKLAKYAIPLNLVLILDDFGDIALNLSIARSTLNSNDAKDAIYGLAAFGASHRLVRFAWGPAKATRSVGVRMIDNTRDYINSIFFVLITAVPFFVFMIFVVSCFPLFFTPSPTTPFPLSIFPYLLGSQGPNR